MARRLIFTIYHGFALSLLLHSVVATPFVMHVLNRQPDEVEPLVIDVQGIAADDQTEQKAMQETKGEAKQEEPVAKPPPASPQSTPPRLETLPPPEAPPPFPPTADQQLSDEEASPSQMTQQIELPSPRLPELPQPQLPKPVETSPSLTQKTPPTPMTNGGVNNVKGVDEQQNGQTIKSTKVSDANRLKSYAKLMARRVRTHLVYPENAQRAGLHGVATVSFTVLGNGQIRPESLHLVESSGQTKLDDAAIRTIRASTPFLPPPYEMTISIGVAFGRRR